MQNEILGDRYQLQEPIGRGGMATIYRAQDLRMDRVVAIKVLREVYSTDPKFVTRFQREAKAASSLQHPNIVQVYDYGQTDGNYFIAMELVEGTDLRRYLRSRGVLAIDRAIIIAHDVALGLGAAHRRGIVHRDVKPQNVLVGRDGSIKLTDFGIASVYKDINAERLTTTGMTLGTVQYYAPEQAQGEIVSPAADVYALGIVMYEMLTGRTPFDGDTPVAVAMQHIQDAPLPPRELNPSIPPELEEIILRCLEKQPEMRYRDGSALARALEMLGDAELGEQMPAPLPGNSLPGTLQSAPLYNPVPQRPGPRSSVSSPGQMLDAPIYEPPYPTPAANGHMGYANQIADPQSMQPMQPMYPSPYSGPSESEATRPFQRGTLPRSNVPLDYQARNNAAIQGGRDLRFASIITVLILLATLLLLGFSIYLAYVLGFIPGSKTATNPTPTSASQQVNVPSLINDNLAQAQAAVDKLGLKLAIAPGSPKSGIVISQNPMSGTVPSGSSITVVFGQKASPTATPITVPTTGVVGGTLANAITTLEAAGITNIKVVNGGKILADNPNTVTAVSPAGGTTLTQGQQVTLTVVNSLNGTPTTSPTAQPSPTAKPSPTATPSPTPTATPSPTPTATPTTTADPTRTQLLKRGRREIDEIWHVLAARAIFRQFPLFLCYLLSQKSYTPQTHAKLPFILEAESQSGCGEGGEYGGKLSPVAFGEMYEEKFSAKSLIWDCRFCAVGGQLAHVASGSCRPQLACRVAEPGGSARSAGARPVGSRCQPATESLNRPAVAQLGSTG